MNLNILNPLSFNKTIIDFNVRDEIKKLSSQHKVITTLAVAILGALSLVSAAIVCQHCFPNFMSSNSNKIVALVVSIVASVRIILFPYLQMVVGRYRFIEEGRGLLKPSEELFYTWAISRQKLISSLIIKGMNNEKTKEMIADCILKNYIDSAKELNSNFKLTEDEHKSLIHSLKDQMGKSAPAQRTIEISKTKKLITYKTEGDGSCGFHALIGEPDNTGTYRCDAWVKRHEFCNWVLNECLSNRLPIKIKEVLIDYFNNFELAPSFFTNKAKHQYADYRIDYNALSEKEREERKEQFAKDLSVVTAYLNNLEKVGTYLLPEELFTVAEWSGKNLILYQKMGTEMAVIESETTHDETVRIFFEGAHFERAEIESF